jgi:hypothetical protein
MIVRNDWVYFVIMQEIMTVPQHAASLHRYVAGDLLHPQFARENGDAGDIHPAALKVDEKQHVVGHQPAQRQHLRSKEVGPRQQRQLGSDEDRCVYRKPYPS